MDDFRHCLNNNVKTNNLEKKEKVVYHHYHFLKVDHFHIDSQSVSLVKGDLTSEYHGLEGVPASEVLLHLSYHYS